jgi:Ca2+-transporting ATPase
LAIDESTLTGETKPVRKTSNMLERCDHPLQLNERKNLCFMGTLVSCGYGSGIAVNIGKQTEFGSVYQLMNDVRFFL